MYLCISDPLNPLKPLIKTSGPSPLARPASNISCLSGWSFKSTSPERCFQLSPHSLGLNTFIIVHKHTMTATTYQNYQKHFMDWWLKAKILILLSQSLSPFTLLPCCCCVASVVSNSVRPHRRQPTRFPHPWDSPGRTLEWVAISFSNAWKWKVKVKSLSRVRL